MRAIRRVCGGLRGPQLCLLLLAASVAILTITAEAKPKHIKNKDDFKSCGGAMKCLGAQKLGRVRRRSGLGHKRVDEIAAQLDTDEDLELDDSAELLLYSCAGMIPDPAEAAAAEAAGVDSTFIAAESVPVYDTAGGAAAAETPHHHHHHHHRHLSQTSNSEISNPWTPDVPDGPISQVDAFRLHSRPNAVKKILLDFDGHITQNSAWNNNRPAQIITPPYDKDGSPSTWNSAELSDILAIWRGVSEDFAPWDVDVTTEDPGDAYLATNGMRVAIGGSSTDWYGSAGGVAYVGKFGKGLSTQPAFVFATSLSNNPKFIWEATSHEVGHTLGLWHDGVAGGTTYYSGTTASPRLWAPIMGASYYCAVTQWSKGEYNGANNLEDDIQIISSFLGPASTNDLVGGTFVTAAPLPATANVDGLTSTGASYGVIHGSSDVDMFSFTTTAAGPVQVTVTVPPRFGTSWAWARSNMAMGVAVLDASNNVLAAASGLGVSTSAVLPAAGTYYVALSSAGMNDPATTGFSSYASAGQYKITATYPSSAAPSIPSPPPPVPSPPPPIPSPPPPPVPSPPPPPAAQLMTIASITTVPVPSGNKVNCNTRVTVVRSDNGVPIPGIQVTVQWSTTPAKNNFPYLATSTSSTNIAAFRSVNLPLATGNTCTASVTAVVAAGFTLDPAAPLVGPTRSW